MRIGFGDIQDLVRAVHGEGRGGAALLGRFKYFQRMSFPGGSNTGRGSRADYGLEQVLALLVAFEVMELGVPPVRVVRLVRTSWERILPALAIAWTAGRTGSDRRLVLAMAPSALAELGVGDDVDAPAPDPITVVSAEEIGSWTAASADVGSPSLYLLDPRRVVLPVTRELVALGAVTAEEVEAAFEELGRRLFGGRPPSRWSLRADRLVQVRERLPGQ